MKYPCSCCGLLVHNPQKRKSNSGKRHVCRKGKADKYELLKCKKCGQVIKDFPHANKKSRKLKITYHPKEKHIWIRGDEKGLEYLASCCLSVIGKHNPSGHIHLQWQMNNLAKGSTETRLEFSDHSEDYK